MSEPDRRLPRRERATSTTLSYVLTLAIATILVSGLFIAGGDFVDDRRQQVVRQEMRVIGHQVASNIEKADRMVEASAGTPVVEVNQSFPARVTGSTYDIELVAGPDPVVSLTSTRPAVSVEVPVRNTTALGNATADGGLVSVQYDDSTDRLVIVDA